MALEDNEKIAIEEKHGDFDQDTPGIEAWNPMSTVIIYEYIILLISCIMIVYSYMLRNIQLSVCDYSTIILVEANIYHNSYYIFFYFITTN